MIKVITDPDIRMRDLGFILEKMITESTINPQLAKFFLTEGLDKMWQEFEDILVNIKDPPINIKRDMKKKFACTRKNIEEIYSEQKQDINIIQLIEFGLTAREIEFRRGMSIYQ